MTLMATQKPPLTWAAMVAELHPCQEGSPCLPLWLVQRELCDVIHWPEILLGENITWPTCVSCKRCLAEPAVWRFPLRPDTNMLCGPCLNAQTGGSYMRYASEEYMRRDWLIKEIGTGHDIRPFPGDLPPKPKRPYTGPDMFKKVKAAIDLAEFANRFTDLRQVGPGKFRGCCPLHQERTGSFYVFSDRQSWRCFGACATGGDVITLTQRLMGLGRINQGQPESESTRLKPHTEAHDAS